MRCLHLLGELVVLCWISTSVNAVNRSPGCEPDHFTALEDGWKSVNVTEDLGSLTRWFWLQVPKSVGEPSDSPAALLLSFHGQFGEANVSASQHSYKELGVLENFVTAFPQGINDHRPGAKDEGTGWNVGTAGDNSTCVPELVGEQASCYESCFLRNKCGPCNWSGCHDDAVFVEVVLKFIADRLCIDLSRVYISGQSNGAMFVHYLTHKLPGTFAAAIPWFGLPLLGHGMGHEYQLFRQAGGTRQTAMLQLHGRNDTIIPVEGALAPGQSGVLGGWIYVPLRTLQNGWAAIHGCNSWPTAVSTPFDGTVVRFACVEYMECSSGRRIMHCLYDGAHGEPAPQSDMATVWFMLQHSLEGPQQGRKPAAAVHDLVV